MPAHRPAARRQFVFRLIPLREQAAATLQKRGALFAHHQTARRAVHQLDAEALFQRVDTPSEDHRRHALLQRRGGQTAGVGDAHEGFDLLEAVHVLSPLSSAVSASALTPAPRKRVATVLRSSSFHTFCFEISDPH
jgi:hypothetical protein